MAHGYRNLHHFDHWLSDHDLGRYFIDAEQHFFKKILAESRGKQAVLVGTPHQESLMMTTPISQRTLISPINHYEKNIKLIEGDLHELPILTGSVELVLLPHTLEFTDNPRKLLAECCRIVKPEGLLMISTFNPYSLWSIQTLLNDQPSNSWTHNRIYSQQLKNWLKLADFMIESHTSFLYSPPLKRSTWRKKLSFLEVLGSKFLPKMGGVNVLLARAKVIPLTPIRLKWKQQLSALPLTGLRQHIAHHSKFK